MRRVPFLLLLITLSISTRAAYSELHWGIEAGSNRSSLDHRTLNRPGEELSTRVLPAVGVLLEQPLPSGWSLSPAIRYVQQGEKMSWHYQTNFGREDEIQHTLGCGIGVRRKLPHSLFLSVDPEITYLLGGTLTQTQWGSTAQPETFEDNVAANSDRWNATIRAGAGKSWRMAGRAASVNLRYVRGVNDMTRIVPSHATGAQRNVGWTASPDPPYVSEWRTESVELVAGILW